MRQHFVEIRWAPSGIITSHQVEQFIEFGGHAGHDLAGHGRAPARQLPDEHLVEQDAQGVDVGGRARIDTAPKELGCHVTDRPETDVGLSNFDAISLERSGHAEISDLDVATPIEEHVLRLQITMDKPLCMRSAKAEGDLNEVAHRDRWREGAAVEQGPQTPAGRQLHDEVRRVVRDVLVQYLNRERGDEARVLTHGRLEAPDDLLALLWREEFAQAREDLDGHGAIDTENAPPPNAPQGADADGLRLQVPLIEPSRRMLSHDRLRHDLSEPIPEMVLKVALQRAQTLGAALGALPPRGRQLENLGPSIERDEPIALEALDELTETHVETPLDPSTDVARIGPSPVLRLRANRAKDQDSVFEEKRDRMGSRGHEHSVGIIVGSRRYLAQGRGSRLRPAESR